MCWRADNPKATDPSMEEAFVCLINDNGGIGDHGCWKMETDTVWLLEGGRR